MGRRTIRLKAAFGIAGVQLWRRPMRTALIVTGIALAVLATTLIASVGFGVLDTGTQKFSESGRDLWITGGPTALSPSSTTPIENSVVDSHRIAADIDQRDDVAVVVPIAFQTVYVGRNASDLRLLTAMGVTGGRNVFSLEHGEGFTTGDIHYANGTYDGPMTREVVVGPRTAALFDVSVGDTLLVGASRASAREERFTIVGVSPEFSQFLGTPTVGLHLSELQEITGAAGTDRATVITVMLTGDADRDAVRAALQRRYPEYEVRTNREQLRSVLGNNAVVFASAAGLVVLAIVAGLALTINLLALVVHQQRQELAALRAIGLAKSTLVAVIGAQGVLLGIVGGALGLAVTPVAVIGLNHVASLLVGFDSLLRTPTMVYVAGFAIAAGIGTTSAAVTAWQLSRLAPLTELQR